MSRFDRLRREEESRDIATCFSPAPFPKVCRKPFWMAVEMPSMLKRYKHRTEERRERDRDRKNRMNEEIKSQQLQQEVIEEEERDWEFVSRPVATCDQISSKGVLGCDGHNKYGKINLKHACLMYQNHWGLFLCHTSMFELLHEPKRLFLCVKLSLYTILHDLYVCPLIKVIKKSLN